VPVGAVCALAMAGIASARTALAVVAMRAFIFLYSNWSFVQLPSCPWFGSKRGVSRSVLCQAEEILCRPTL